MTAIEADDVQAVVLDASVLIGYLTPHDAHQVAAQRILDADEWVRFVLHPHTLAEVLVGPARRNEVGPALAAFDRAGIERWNPDPDYPRRIAVLRAESGLGLADCCPLDLAQQVGAGLATFDARLAAAARTRGVDTMGL